MTLGVAAPPRGALHGTLCDTLKREIAGGRFAGAEILEQAAAPRRHIGKSNAIGSSLHDALEARRFKPVRVLQRLRASLLADAASLGVEPKSPALCIQRIAYLADGRCVEFRRSCKLADTYDFVSELTLSPATRKNRSERLA